MANEIFPHTPLKRIFNVPLPLPTELTLMNEYFNSLKAMMPLDKQTSHALEILDSQLFLEIWETAASDRDHAERMARLERIWDHYKEQLEALADPDSEYEVIPTAGK